MTDLSLTSVFLLTEAPIEILLTKIDQKMGKIIIENLHSNLFAPSQDP